MGTTERRNASWSFCNRELVGPLHWLLAGGLGCALGVSGLFTDTVKRELPASLVTPVGQSTVRLESVGDCSSELSMAQISTVNLPSSAVENPQEWQKLTDSAEPGTWANTEFGSPVVAEFREGVWSLPPGDPLTGITWQGQNFPENDYELELEARRVSGIDFFCCLTFPVRDSHCSLVVGGWGGTVVGISSLDEEDAARNETKKVMKFANGNWYRIRIRVCGDELKAWIDDRSVVDVNITGKTLSVRNEVRLSRPLGICSFQSLAEIRNVRWRAVEPR